MSETTADALRRIDAELRGLPEALPLVTMLATLGVPLPPLPFSTIENAPGWVARRIDGCPGRRCTAYVTPALWAIEDTANGTALVAAYRCNHCREAWWTSWAVAPEEMVA